MPANWGKLPPGGPNDDQGPRQRLGMKPLSRVMPNAGEAFAVAQIAGKR